ncbi:hypothetical protein M4951_12565 [Blastopirellula sp. J2-11]|uniref:hypothetical protein n=1 Tax=Blastopirellula sp. J2-11 TaxID=2943192 RepID=UPI0021C79FA3|nr:hypothetical protein [Blastopirellula sp. J2-11]UUO09116.1 hypothetical protein M4951_12565 [Blastopirellula sp. J2-11]
MLLSTAVLAMVCWTLASAVRGHGWAIAVMLSLVALAIWVLGQAMLFSVAALASAVFGATQRKTLRSPFANETPAPQILPTDHHVAD